MGGLLHPCDEPSEVVRGSVLAVHSAEGEALRDLDATVAEDVPRDAGDRVRRVEARIPGGRVAGGDQRCATPGEQPL